MSHHSTTNSFTIIAAVGGFVAVALGAFGAHGLEAMVSADRLETWHTGVLYHFVHVFALLFTSLLRGGTAEKKLKFAGYFFIAGTCLFSGSLYLLVLLDLPVLGMITPVGGLLFLAGWVMLALGSMAMTEVSND